MEWNLQTRVVVSVPGWSLGVLLGSPGVVLARVRVGGWCAALVTSATLQHSIIIGEGRGLDPWNRLEHVVISVPGWPPGALYGPSWGVGARMRVGRSGAALVTSAGLQDSIFG